MREHKYRIFNKTLEKYIYSDEFESGGIETLNLYFFFKFVEDMRDCDNKFWELEQYTGLKDKNGKEIYEGDILSLKSKGFERNSEIKNRTYLIKYNYELLRFLGDTKDSFGWKEIVMFSEGEIIGNIHENPELLEKII